LGDEGVVAEAGLGGVGGVVKDGYFGGVGVVLDALGLDPLASDEPGAPDLIRVLDVDFEVGFEVVEEEGGELCDVVLCG
jgi:hypothetical protein